MPMSMAPTNPTLRPGNGRTRYRDLVVEPGHAEPRPKFMALHAHDGSVKCSAMAAPEAKRLSKSAPVRTASLTGFARVRETY
jgi:hypothetical protein